MRRLDWPERLAAFLAEAESRAFSESYPCMNFAADAVLAMTGVDPLPNRDETIAAAYARMRREGFETVSDAIAAKVAPAIPLAFARRGDVIEGRDGDTPAVGVCCGERTAFPCLQGGLDYRPTLDQFAAYPVR